MSSALIVIPGIAASTGTTAFGPQSPNYTTSEPNVDPNVSGAVDTWGKDCTAAGATNGTYFTSSWFNNVTGNLRTLVRGAGLPLTDGDNSMLYNAVVTLALGVVAASAATAVQIENGTGTGTMTPAAFEAAAGNAFLFPIIVSTVSPQNGIGATVTGTGLGNAISGTTYGSGIGVNGQAQNGSGVFGQSVNGYGVYGLSNTSIGVYGSTASATGNGIVGNITGTGAGVAGVVTGAGNGVSGSALSNGTGVYGTSAGGGYGVFGSSSAIGIYGTSTANGTGVEGLVSGTGAGILGYSSGTGYAVSGVKIGATGYAGYFSGNVYVTGTVTSSSDATLKRSVEDVPDAAAITWSKQLRFVDFTKLLDASDTVTYNAKISARFKAVTTRLVSALNAEETLIDSLFGAGATQTAVSGVLSLTELQSLLAAYTAKTVTSSLSSNDATTLSNIATIIQNAISAAPTLMPTDDAALTVGRQAGVIAQEVQALAAATGYGAWIVVTSPSGKLSVDYQSLMAVVAKGNQLRLAALEALAEQTSASNFAAATTAAAAAADALGVQATAALPAASRSA